MEHDEAHIRLERCVRACAERAWRMACGLVGDGQDAHEVVQRACVVAASKPGAVPSGDPWPWFSQVLLFEARNFRRGRSRDNAKTVSLDEGAGASLAQAKTAQTGEGDPAMIVQRDEAAEMLRAALDALPDDEREALVITRMMGLSHREASEAMSVPLGTLNDRVRRGLERLRERLRASEDAVCNGLLALPLALPAGGLDGAVSAWLSAANAHVGAAAMAVSTSVSSSVSGASTTSTVASHVGGTVMGKKLGIAIGVIIGLGIGVPTTALLSSTMRDDVKPNGACAPTPTDSDWRGGGGSDAVNDARYAAVTAELAALRDEATGLRRDKAALEGENGTLREQVVAAKSAQPKLTPAVHVTPAKKGPAIAFGPWVEMEGLAPEKMADLADSLNDYCALRKKITDMGGWEKFEARRKQDPALAAEIKQAERKLTDTFMKLITSGATRLPTHLTNPPGNGLTHPILLINILAAQLERVGMPLNDGQRQAVVNLGEAFAQALGAKQTSYGSDAFLLEKILDELELKKACMDGSIGLLSPEQRQAIEPLLDEKTDGFTAVPLYTLSLAFMGNGGADYFVGPSRQDIQGRIPAYIAELWGVEPVALTGTEYIVNAWVDAIEPTTQSMGADGNVLEKYLFLGREQVKAFKDMITQLSPAEPILKNIRDSEAIIVLFIESEGNSTK